MELRHLRYFVAVGEEEHFGRAAERLHVVQPALTRQVRQLEEELGCALFERLKWGVRLTEAGKSFLEEARRLLSDLGRGVDRTRLVAQGKIGCLRVGVSYSVTHGEELSSILRRFRTSSPDVRLELFLTTSISAGEQLRNQEADVAWFPRSAANFVYDPVLSACHKAGFTLKIVHEVNSPTTMLSLVAGGIGLSFVIESAKRTKPKGVVLREVAGLRVTPQLSIVWRKDNKAPALQRFVEMIRSQFAEVDTSAHHGNRTSSRKSTEGRL